MMMKTISTISLLILMTIVSFAQTGLDRNGKEISGQATMINKYGAIGSGTGVTKHGQSFTATPVLATLTTTAVSSILSSKATSGGNITNAGNASITARGVVWSLSPSPTIALGTQTTNDTGTGTFTSIITGLSASTAYYVRAYATNSAGTSYGNQVTFTTSAPPPYMVGGNAICDDTFTTEVVEVVGIGGAIWMDRNLGASRAATSPTDYEAYGCLYQWGRGNDGHASITWTGATAGTPVNGTTATFSLTDIPGHSLFIKGVSPTYDWRSTQNNNLWQGVAGVNNPCPAGFRPPTLAELKIQTPDYNTAFNGILKFTLPGRREYGAGGLMEIGGQTAYLSSTITQWAPRHSVLCRVVASDRVSDFEYGKTTGYPVRCIKN